MATMITSECINCGACEPECPNTAIYQGGVEWDLDGAKHPALTQDIFFIVPEKCTECVGFYDHEACAAVCPVDCCIPNPDIPETEAQLIARAKQLHPETAFTDDFPSRFRAGGAPAAAPVAEASSASAVPQAAPAAEVSSASAVPPAVPAAPAAPAAAKAAAPAAAPLAAAPTPGARVERPLAAPKPSLKLQSAPARKEPFAGELSLSFEEAVAELGGPRATSVGPLKWLVALAMPLLGALPASQKKVLERAVGDRRFFSSSGATGLNLLHNMIIYPAVCVAVGALWLDRSVFSAQLKSMTILGVAIASLEAIWRLREGVLYARPAEEMTYRASVYGLPLALLMTPVVRLLSGPVERHAATVPVDGFHSPDFEDKIERRRRYGEVYTLTELANGYLLRMELPRTVPPSAQKTTQGMPDEMPDYKRDLELQSGYFVVKGKVVDPNLRKAAAVSSAFPPDFTTHVKLPRPVRAFKHRYQDKVLEVALLCAS